MSQIFAHLQSYDFMLFFRVFCVKYRSSLWDSLNPYFCHHPFPGRHPFFSSFSISKSGRNMMSEGVSAGPVFHLKIVHILRVVLWCFNFCLSMLDGCLMSRKHLQKKRKFIPRKMTKKWSDVVLRRGNRGIENQKVAANSLNRGVFCCREAAALKA